MVSRPVQEFAGQGANAPPPSPDLLLLLLLLLLLILLLPRLQPHLWQKPF